MGLDVVEIVLQCEETFEIKLEDWRLEQMHTVGDLFELSCQQLGLPFGPQEPRPTTRAFIPLAISSQSPPEGWNRQSVWRRSLQYVLINFR